MVVKRAILRKYLVVVRVMKRAILYTSDFGKREHASIT